MHVKRILMAEDNAKDIELAMAALEEHHLTNEVIIVRDGEEALHYLRREGRYQDRPEGNPAVGAADLHAHVATEHPIGYRRRSCQHQEDDGRRGDNCRPPHDKRPGTFAELQQDSDPHVQERDRGSHSRHAQRDRHEPEPRKDDAATAARMGLGHVPAQNRQSEEAKRSRPDDPQVRITG